MELEKAAFKTLFGMLLLIVYRCMSDMTSTRADQPGRLFCLN